MSQLGRWYCPLAGRGQGCCRTSYHAQDATPPTVKDSWAPNVNTLQLRSPDAERSIELIRAIRIVNVKSAFWHGRPVAVRLGAYRRPRPANFEPRLPPSAVTCRPQTAAVGGGGCAGRRGRKGGGRGAILKGARGKVTAGRKMVSCRPRGWGTEGWASPLGFPVCRGRARRAAPRVGRRPLPPGCWLESSAGDWRPPAAAADARLGAVPPGGPGGWGRPVGWALPAGPAGGWVPAPELKRRRSRGLARRRAPRNADSLPRAPPSPRPWPGGLAPIRTPVSRPRRGLSRPPPRLPLFPLLLAFPGLRRWEAFDPSLWRYGDCKAL